ncbi:MAG: Hsp20/alpha crystallin family protein [Chloroflexi bacterium]|nr:Hsp20/alpha crystallin family protein [Chloroflexota bacterium]
MPTTVTRWNPFTEIERIWPRDLFSGDFFGRLRPGGELAVEWSPRCDVTENDNAIVVHAEIPGVEAKDVTITVEGSELLLRGEKQSEKKEEKEGRTYSERFFGSFERAIAIPEGVDASKIEAKMKDGVLEVRVPRPAASKPGAKKIEIKVN